MRDILNVKLIYECVQLFKTGETAALGGVSIAPRRTPAFDGVSAQKNKVGRPTWEKWGKVGKETGGGKKKNW